jgi:hypothetical protein
MGIIFSAIAQPSYMLTPEKVRQDTEFAIILDNLTDHILHTRLEKGDLTTAEFAAKVMDEYFSTVGVNDMYSLRDMSYKLRTSFADAYHVLTTVIAPEIEMLSKRIDDLASQMLDKRLGHTDNQGNYSAAAPKFRLLDVQQMYQRYNQNARDCAVQLCKKYNYHVEYLNNTNISDLLTRIAPTNDIQVSSDTLSAILEDSIIIIKSDGDGEVVVNTSEPDAVKVDGDGSNVTVNGDTTPDDNGGSSESTPEEGGNANVDITTGNDDANISVSINGEEVTTEEKELLAMMLKACFSSLSFQQLKSRLFAEKGMVRGSNLLDTLYFLSHSLHTLVEKAGSKHLSPTTMLMVRENLSRVHELQMGALIFLDVQSTKFADKLIIDRNLLNKNLVNKAIADGVDIYPVLRDYMRVYHNNNPEDIYHAQMQDQSFGSGITYDQVVVTRYNVEQKLINAKSSTVNDMKNLMTDTRRQAYKSVLTTYVREVAARSSDAQLKVNPNDKGQFITRNDQRIDVACELMQTKSDTVSVEDMLYNFYLSNWYGGTMVEELYRYMSEYLRQSATTTKLTAETVKMAKAQAIADIGSKFMFDSFIR